MKRPAAKPDLQIEAGTVSILDFVSFPVSETTKVTSRWAETRTVSKSGQWTCLPYYMFGACDALAVSFAKNLTQAMLVSDRFRKHRRDELNSNSLHLGVVAATYPAPFSLSQAVADSPLLGCITMKMRADAWSIVLASKRDDESIRKMAGHLLEEAMEKTSRSCRTSLNGYRAAVVLSFDSEDVTILLFSRSFRFVKRFTTTIRTLELDDMAESVGRRPMKHVLASTNTALGLSINRRWRNRQNLLRFGNLCLDEPLNWQTFLQTRPGHMQCAINGIKRAKGCHALQVEPIVGRNDLLIRPQTQRPGTLKRFLVTHGKLIDAIGVDQSSISTETVLGFPDLHRNESRDEPNGVRDGRRPERTVIMRTLKSVQNDRTLHEYERQALSAILRKLLVLGEDCYIQDSYVTTATTCVIGIRRYLEFTASQRLDMNDRLDTWIACLELSHASRYTGNPPVGETAVSPTLGQYISGQKALTLCDNIANLALMSFTDRLTPSYFEYSVVSSLYANCYQTTCIPFEEMLNYFIALPYGIAMDPGVALVMFCHELGHVLFSCFLASPKIDVLMRRGGSKLADGIIDNYDELMAELFCAKLLHGCDFKKHRRAVNALWSRMHIRNRSVRAEFVRRKQDHIDGAMEISKGIYPPRTDRITKAVVSGWADAVMSWDHPIIPLVRTAIESQQPAWDLWRLWAHSNSLMKTTLDHSSK